MWRVFRVIQKGCTLRDIRFRPSLIATGAGDDHCAQEGQQGRTLGSAAGQLHATPVTRPIIRFYEAEDLQWEETGRRSTAVHLDCEDQTAADGVDPHEGSHCGRSSAKSQQEAKENCENDEAQQEREANWTQSFQHDMWSYKQPCHILEAVGWGTAIVSGFRISHFLHSSRDRHDGVDRCWLTQLQKLATSVLKHHLLQFETGCYSMSSSVKCVLPHGVFSSLPLPAVAREASEKRATNSLTKASTVFNTKDCQAIPSVNDIARTCADVKDTSRLQFETAAAKTATNVAVVDSSDSEMAVGYGAWGETVRSIEGMISNAEGVEMAHLGNMEAAIKLWKKAIEEADCTQAHFNLALAYEQGLGVERNIDKALEHYNAAVQKDHPASLFNSAMIHLHSQDGISQNRAAAVALLERAAHLGLKEAQRELGVLFTELPDRDMKRAVVLFQQAVEQKDVKATYFLGICYENGWGIERNESTAAVLYERAAVGGHAEAQFNLGVFHETGRGGLSVDKRKAMELYKLAATNGCLKAKEQLLKRLDGGSGSEAEDDIFNEPDLCMVNSVWLQSTLTPDISRLISGSDSDTLSKESDFEFASSSSASDLSIGSPSLSPQRWKTPHSMRRSGSRRKSLRSSVSVGFSSDEGQSETSDVEEYEKHRTVKRFANVLPS